MGCLFMLFPPRYREWYKYLLADSELLDRAISIMSLGSVIIPYADVVDEMAKMAMHDEDDAVFSDSDEFVVS